MYVCGNVCSCRDQSSNQAAAQLSINQMARQLNEMNT